MDMWDFRMYVRECIRLGQKDDIIKILTEENVIPQGEWIEKRDALGRRQLYCNKCGIKAQVGSISFCGQCGAKMITD